MSDLQVTGESTSRTADGNLDSPIAHALIAGMMTSSKNEIHHRQRHGAYQNQHDDRGNASWNSLGF